MRARMRVVADDVKRLLLRRREIRLAPALLARSRPFLPLVLFLLFLLDRRSRPTLRRTPLELPLPSSSSSMSKRELRQRTRRRRSSSPSPSPISAPAPDPASHSSTRARRDRYDKLLLLVLLLLAVRIRVRILLWSGMRMRVGVRRRRGRVMVRRPAAAAVRRRAAVVRVVRVDGRACELVKVDLWGVRGMRGGERSANRCDDGRVRERGMERRVRGRRCLQ